MKTLLVGLFLASGCTAGASYGFGSSVGHGPRPIAVAGPAAVRVPIR